MFRGKVVHIADVDERHAQAVSIQCALTVTGVEVGHFGVSARGVEADRYVRDPHRAGGVVGAEEPENLPPGGDAAAG